MSLNPPRTEDDKQERGMTQRTGVEKHVAHCRRLLVHLERMASEDDTFGDYPCGIWVYEATHSHEVWGCESDAATIELGIRPRLLNQDDIP